MNYLLKKNFACTEIQTWNVHAQDLTPTHWTIVAAYRLAPRISLYSDSLCITIARPHLSFATWGDMGLHESSKYLAAIH